MPEVSAQPLHRRLVNFAFARAPVLVEARLSDALRRCVRARLANSGVPGVQVCLAVDDRPIRSFAFGLADAQRGIPMRENTPWRLASLGKPLASMVFLRLVAKGTFTLDEPLNPLLQDVAPQVCESPLTARALVSHTAGLEVLHPPHFEARTDAARNATIVKALLGECGPPRPVRSPGHHGTLYTGVGWMLLQHAMEQRTGEAFASLAEDCVIRPLGLQATSFAESARYDDALAAAHNENGQVLPVTVSPAHASTGLVSTMADCVTSMRALIDAASSRGLDFLPADLAKEALEPQPKDLPDAGFTLTHFLFSRDPYTLTHGGFRPGLRSTLTVFPQQRIIAAFAANSDLGFEVIKPWLGLLGSMASAR